MNQLECIGGITAVIPGLLLWLDGKSGEQAGFTQARIGCDGGGGSGGNRRREVKRNKAAEAHRTVREPQTANEIRRLLSNFGAQRSQDYPAREAIRIEAGDRPSSIGPGDVTEPFLPVQGGRHLDTSQQGSEQRARCRFDEAEEIVPIRFLCVDFDERGRIPEERTQTRSSLSCSRIRSIGRAGFLRTFMVRWSSRSSSAQALPSAAGSACRTSVSLAFTFP